MYTDEQIVQSLPPALQGELKEFGPLETKTPEQLREFLVTKREQYKIPPWHVFTLLLKRAALAVGDSHQATKTNSWYTTDVHLGENEEGYTLDAEEAAPYCHLIVNSRNNHGYVVRTELFVQPSTKKIWKVDTERLCLRGQVYCSSPDTPREHVNMPAKKILAYARRALATKKDRCVWEYTVRHRRPNGTGRRAKVVAPDLDEPSEVSVEKPMEQVQDNRFESISESQKEIIRTLLDMAAVKARELNMHTTIVRWRHALENIIGEETANAENPS